jgi:hypothetical protein
MLGAAAAGSAEHEALQEELRRRDEILHCEDRDTKLLFTQVTWEKIKR